MSNCIEISPVIPLIVSVTGCAVGIVWVFTSLAECTDRVHWLFRPYWGNILFGRAVRATKYGGAAAGIVVAAVFSVFVATRFGVSPHEIGPVYGTLLAMSGIIGVAGLINDYYLGRGVEIRKSLQTQITIIALLVAAAIFGVVNQYACA